MNERKSLWFRSAVFRWFVYQIALVVFGLLVRAGVIEYDYLIDQNPANPYEFLRVDLLPVWYLVWVLVFTIPALWVWRNQLKRIIGWLDKKAEEE